MLVRPEPRRPGKRALAAHERGGGGLALLGGVLDGFEPHESAVRLPAGGAVAGRDDERVGGSGAVVDDDAVIAGESAGGCQLVIGARSGSDNNEVGG